MQLKLKPEDWRPYLTIQREPAFSLVEGSLQREESFSEKNSASELLLVEQTELQGATLKRNEVGQFKVEDVPENGLGCVLRHAREILNLLRQERHLDDGVDPDLE